MELLGVLLIAALVFGVCYLVDKGFQMLFRNQQEHHSGLAVRLNKKYGAMGLIVAVLGLGAVFADISPVLMAGGILLIVIGIGLVVYYMSFGIFYDTDTFVLTTFGKKSKTYAYQDIVSQQLYTSAAGTLVELYLNDGRTVQLQIRMAGVCPFLDHAFWAWLRQTNRRVEDCAFYDPENSCWFPPAEE